MKTVERRKVIAGVTQQALEIVRELKKRCNMTKVHLSYDYGRFGSESFKRQMFYKSEDLLVKFQNDLYSYQVSFTEYEQSYTTLF